ncbi:manganese efflux pump MntP family protein [Methanobacterium sp. SMA-27]|uniref:manganese efflux pump MntP n=1 Tax=Methanobacterium sp. SMA-27 TaxID=1495336 RepID=UPI00064EE0D0|nr:manganese efflux pump MntP family protein [Methanobacterium sp. SMA-27]
MNFIIIFFIAVGLAMDACFVSITKGMVDKTNIKHALIIALFFGGFQGFMTIGGWIIGIPLQQIVSTLAPWIAFILISIIGIKMIYESFADNEDDDDNGNFSIKEITILAIATSIDAFVVGISFALLNTPIIEPSIIIGVVAFILSFIGVYIGKRLGHLFGKEIEVIGGVILILIGIYILIGF